MSFTAGVASEGTWIEGSTNVTRLKYSSKLLATMAAGGLCAVLAAHQGDPAQDTPSKTNATGATVKGFLDRVNAYLELQKKAEDGLPKLSKDEDPSKIEAHQAALAGRLKLARQHARPGDLFGDAAPLFKSVMRDDRAMRSLRDAWAAMEEVPKFDPPKVNAAYPEKLPLATVPPLILDQLPPLPEGLEYRFMGSHLILRDVKANLIADFIDNAVPVRNGK